jgi:hypothetical protein
MDLATCLIDFGAEHIDTDNIWYDYDFDTSAIPVRLTISGGTSYHRNVELKYGLHKHWKAGDDSAKEKVIRWFICDWGGIRGHKEETMKCYANSDPKDLISRGKCGVASWSKALSIYNPDRYAIFDARVSTSLNALQIISGVQNPTLFPVLPSQNSKISKGNRLFPDYAVSKRWRKLQNTTYYSTYMRLLEQTLAELPKTDGIGIYTIEMLLFAKAEELLFRAFSRDEVLGRS